MRGVRHCPNLLVLLAATACIPQLPENLGRQPDLDRWLLGEADGLRVFGEGGLNDGAWVEVVAPGAEVPIGGYLSGPDRDVGMDGWLASGPPGLVLILPGASTYYDDGAVAKARDYHHDFAAELRASGFRTWTLVIRECGTPYGEGDLADTLAVIDWLDSGGRRVLGVDRVHLVGYSAGATVAYRVQLRRRLDSIVAIDGLAGTKLFDAWWPLGTLVVALYPQNTGICQFASTRDAYGRPPSEAWAAFDTAARVESMRNPMLVIHGMLDIIFPVGDALRLRDAYDAAVAAGRAVVPIEFLFIPGGGHIDASSRPDVRRGTGDYLKRIENGTLKG